MKRFSQILLYVTIVLLLVWQLPWCYNFFTSKPEKTPFTLYSFVIDDFAMMGQEGDKGMVRRDLSGNTYTQAQFDSILPMFYVRQLMADERFPDTINGVPVTPRLVQMENFNFRTVPSDINAPRIGLYPLLESMSGRVDLKMPGDVFRITDTGIEFVTIASNTIDHEKSSRFTEAMKKKGFVFPALEISGNPTTRKDYDEGYMLLDANRHLFHLKQVKDRPYVRAVDLPAGLELKHLFITEFKNRKTLAFMTDVNNTLYVLNNKTYDVVKVGIPAFNPEADAMTVMGNMFDWTIRITRPHIELYYAVDANDYSLIKVMELPASELSVAEKVGKYIFPLRLSFTSGTDKYVRARF